MSLPVGILWRAPQSRQEPRRWLLRAFAPAPNGSSIPLVGEDQSQTGRRRLTVAETSAVLGVTVQAVRGRIKRRTLDHERTAEGVFVLLDTDHSADRPRPATN
jgi:hypothetical protein